MPAKLHKLVYPTRKTSYDEFIKNSQFGCADCYSVFGPLMEESLKQLQGSTAHTGKRPKYQKISYKTPDLKGSGDETAEDAVYENEEEIMKLDAKLKEALQFEDYETAAVCRDKIRELKKGHETNA